MLKAIYFLLIIAIVSGIIGVLYSRYEPQTITEPVTADEGVMCTMDAMQCPDGSYVGRTGPQCEFVCPPAPAVPPDIQARIDSYANKIVLDTPMINGILENGAIVSGQARGGWYFEASFPIVLVNWDGLIIAETPATAQSDWMTPEFVPYTANLDFVSPYKEGDPDFMKNGTLILKKDNASGLPENDDSLEIPVRFAP